MHSISRDNRRATRDLDMDFIKYSLDDDSIHNFILKLNTVKDGMKVLKTILSMYKDYKPRKFFFALAILLFILGLIPGIPVIVEFAKTHFITKVPSAILATGFMLMATVAFQCGIILDTIVKANKQKYELNLIRYEETNK